MKEEKCYSCKYFHREELSGECRRNPPFPYPSGSFHHDNFPRVSENSFCGEYQEKTEEGEE